MKVNNIYKENETVTLENYLTKCGVKDIKEFINPTGKYIETTDKYSNDDMDSAIQILTENKDISIIIVQDGDTDGICSAVILYQYLALISNKYDIQILIHTSKQRGLDDENIMNEIRKQKPNVVIVPDAGTNNKEQAEELDKLGIKLIVIDHHDYKEPIEKGILINNQNPNYTCQRNGSGALVTHKFLQRFDTYIGENWSSYLIDLVALSLVSDSMNMSEMENREYYHYGLEQYENITNTFLKACIAKFIGENKEYTQRDLSFKVIPKFNSICRCQDQELKEKLILAFIGLGDIKEMLELCKQAHENQQNKVAEIIENNKDKIEELSNNNIVIFASDEIPRSYSGLVCGKVMNLSGNKPSLVGSIKNGTFLGSLRSPIPLRSQLDNSNLVDWANGHEDSCGIQIQADNIQKLIDYYNGQKLDYSPHIDVLNTYSIKSIPRNLYGLFEPYMAFFGKGIEQPKFYIKDIVITPNNISILGTNKRTLKIHTEYADLMIFNCTKQDKVDLGLGYYNEKDEFVENRKDITFDMTCVGSLCLNRYTSKKNGKTYINNQIVIDKYELKKHKILRKEDLFKL